MNVLVWKKRAVVRSHRESLKILHSEQVKKYIRRPGPAAPSSAFYSKDINTGVAQTNGSGPALKSGAVSSGNSASRLVGDPVAHVARKTSMTAAAR